MRKSLCVGILKERKPFEKRAPIVPKDVKWLVKHGIDVEIESDDKRVFKDCEYKANGAKVVERFEKANLLVGIKEPTLESIYTKKIYMVFSHTMKGQSQNASLLKRFLENKITLVDYEDIRDQFGKRLVYFGRFAGICGAVDSLYYLGKKLEYNGIKTPFLKLKPAREYISFRKLREAVREVNDTIERRGFDRRLSPFIIGITGHGNASAGVQEILDLLNPIEVHPKDMLWFIKHRKGARNRMYKIVFLREEKFRPKDRREFYFEEYLKRPEHFESNLDKYLQFINLLIHTSYWDKRFPRLVTKDMMNNLARRNIFRLEFIGDISCDINGSIELTYKSTTPQDPVFTYHPTKRIFTDGYQFSGVTVLAVDNLPTELPRDSSTEFSSLIREYVYQIAAHGAKDITNHAALPQDVRGAVITQNGRLTKKYKYLKDYVYQ